MFLAVYQETLDMDTTLTQLTASAFFYYEEMMSRLYAAFIDNIIFIKKLVSYNNMYENN